jgi:cytochrome c2
MNCFGKSGCLALALAGIVGAAAADEDQAQAGREVFDRRCRPCHGGTAPADYPIGPSLAGVVASRAGSSLRFSPSTNPSETLFSGLQ